MADKKNLTNNKAPLSGLPPINEKPGQTVPPIIPPIAPATGTPVSPAGVDKGSSAGMSQDQMKADLNSTMSDLANKRGAMNSQYYVSKNKIESAKAELIQSIFDILKTVGVDPTNMESIQSFIQQLQEQDPDLLKLFNVAFDALATAPEAAPNIGDISAGQNEPTTPSGRPPVGTSGLEPQIPLPQRPEGALGQPVEAPGVSGKFKNVSGMMPKQ